MNTDPNALKNQLETSGHYPADRVIKFPYINGVEVTFLLKIDTETRLILDCRWTAEGLPSSALARIETFSDSVVGLHEDYFTYDLFQ